MDEELTRACRAAADALQVLSHLRPNVSRNVVPRLNSTSTSVSQCQAINNGERQAADNEERSGIATNEECIDRNSSIQARLANLFPTLGSNRDSRRRGSSKSVRPKQPKKSARGRPTKNLVYKDLVVLRSQKINKVSTHTTRLHLEKRELVCHEFPFDKSWDANALKAAILNRFPKLLVFEYATVGSFSSHVIACY
ncbi:uncharacterized protein [Montipora foliosa]|uniref:uncharacterized protein n=1 Tax=Montipora foliosa TaxID=591990 RepID=UPI0035F1541C